MQKAYNLYLTINGKEHSLEKLSGITNITINDIKQLKNIPTVYSFDKKDEKGERIKILDILAKDEIPEHEQNFNEKIIRETISKVFRHLNENETTVIKPKLGLFNGNFIHLKKLH